MDHGGVKLKRYHRLEVPSFLELYKMDALQVYAGVIAEELEIVRELYL